MKKCRRNKILRIIEIYNYARDVIADNYFYVLVQCPFCGRRFKTGLEDVYIEGFLKCKICNKMLTAYKGFSAILKQFLYDNNKRSCYVPHSAALTADCDIDLFCGTLRRGGFRGRYKLPKHCRRCSKLVNIPNLERFTRFNELNGLEDR